MTWNLADLFERVVDAVPDRIALVTGGRRLSFAALDARANRLAHALAARGVGAGDHLGLYLYNGHEFLEAMLAAFKLRAVPINVNYRYVEDELADLFRRADLAALIHERELGARVDAAAPPLRVRLATGEDYEAAVAAAPSDERRFAPRSSDDLHIIFTGGTTGMPRGVMWRHEDLFFAGLQGGNPGGAPLSRPEDIGAAARARATPMAILPAAPFIHGAAQFAAFICWFTGGKVVVDAGRSFSAHRILELIQEERVNTITIVGDAMARPICDALAEKAYDASPLMVISSGGAILSASVREELARRLPYTMVLNAFGASETGHQGTMLPGVGGAAFVMDATSAVLGDDGRPVAPGSGVVGRLARRGHLPLGYYNDPEKTAATFVVVDGVRWSVPGDLATLEADGRIVVLGRGAMCINSGGEKVFPEEVEEALKAHPGVVDAVVVGLPDERWGQRVAAVVQARPGVEVTLPVLDEHCRRRIAGYKVPRELRVVPEVVRHPSGKPDYRWAREVLGLMYLDYTPEQKRLRAELRRYLAELVTDEVRAETTGAEGGGPRYSEVMRRLGADGWLGVGWPREVGGQGRSPIDEFIFFDEIQRTDFPIPFLTLCTVGPTLWKHGTEEQKARFLPAILRGECHFAIGYTEPEAGTDLASLRTRAIRDGDDYVVNGQKVFTSQAEYADFIWLAARTDPAAAKHRGISILLVDTKLPGASMNPIRTLAGTRTNAVYFEDVRVPAALRVGREHEGWKIITTQLNHERVALSAPGAAARSVEETIAWARENGAIAEPWVQLDLARAQARVRAVELMALRQAWQIGRGELNPAESSAVKVFGSESFVEIYRLLLGVLGPAGALRRGSPGAALRGRLEMYYRATLVLTFGGGTNEVQRDIIAAAGLGMPRGAR